MRVTQSTDNIGLQLHSGYIIKRVLMELIEVVTVTLPTHRLPFIGGYPSHTVKNIEPPLKFVGTNKALYYRLSNS